MIKELTSIANELDARGLSVEADSLDIIIRSSLALDLTQGGLGVLGLFPGLGEIADGTNAAISALRNDPVGTVLSLISMVPVVGDAIGKGLLTLRAAIRSGVAASGGARDVMGIASSLSVQIDKNSDLIRSYLRDADALLARTTGEGYAIMEKTWDEEILPMVQSAAA